MDNLTVESSALAMDIGDILEWNKKHYTPYFQIQFDIHTEVGDYGTDQGVYLQELNVVRDYENNYGDYMQVTLMMQLGTYIHDVYPYLSNAEASIRLRRQNIYDDEASFHATRYKLIYLPELNENIPNTLSVSRNDLNQLPPVGVKFQLYDRGLEVLRIKTLQGCFDGRVDGNRMDVKSFINSVLVNECNKIMVERESIIDRISIEEPDNQSELKSVVLPSGTKVLDLPKWLQESSQGVYNGGIGVYLQPYTLDGRETLRTLFVYSLYGTGKFDELDYKTILYSPISSKYSLNEKNYSYSDRILRLLANNVNNIPDHTATIAREGIGYRSAHAELFMTKPIEVGADGPEYMKYGINNEVLSMERPDGNNYAPYEGITANNHHLASKILKNRGVLMTAEVMALDPDYIYPGMPIKVVHEKKDSGIGEYYGTVLRSITKYIIASGSPLITHSKRQDDYQSHTVLELVLTEGI